MGCFSQFFNFVAKHENCFVVKVFHIQCQRFTIKFDVGILKDDVIAELNSFVRRVEFVGPETRHRPWGWGGLWQALVWNNIKVTITIMYNITML